MNSIEDAAERVLPAEFAAQADTCADPQDVLAVVRGRVRARQSAGPALMVAALAVAVAAVVGTSAAVVGIFGHRGPTKSSVAADSNSQAAGESHHGLDRLSGTCLDMAQVNRIWVMDPSL